MADNTTTIDGLPSASTPLAGSEEVPIWQGGATKKVPVSAIGGGSGTGTVTSVSAASPLSITGTPTVNPTVNIATANTSTSGALTNTDWNTFNNKQAQLVSGTNIKTVNGASLLGSGDLSVGGVTTSGTPTTNYVPKFTSSTVIGNSLVFDNGTSVGINTNTPSASYILDVAGDIRAGSTGAGAVATNPTWNAYPTPFKVTIPNYSAYWGIVVQNATYGGSSGLELGVSDTGVANVNISDSTGTAYNAMQMFPTGKFLLAPTAGSVGVGITGTPAAKLDVAGTTKLGATGSDTVTLTGQVSANGNVGTSGQLLTSRGANLSPQWASLNLSSPPAIGSTTPNVITGTTITANNALTANSGATFANGGSTNYGTGVIACVDDGLGDGYNALTIYVDDPIGGLPYAPWFPGGIAAANFIIRSQDWATNYQYVQLQVPSGMSAPYTLTLPSTAGSTGQFLKTDGTGTTSWGSAQKTITSGTAAPSGGSDGDIYLQYT